MHDRKLVQNLDVGILLLIAALVCFGLVGIGAALRLPLEGGETLAQRLSSFNMHYVIRQLIFFGSGLALLVMVLLFDYTSFKRIAVVLYWIVVAMLLFLNVQGVIRGGAQSWFKFGDFMLQPSEFGKLAIIIMMAKRLAGNEDDEDAEEEPQWKKVLSCLMIMGLPLVLVVMQPDFGTAMVYVVIFFVMLFVGGIRIWWLLGMIGAAAAAAPTLYFTMLSQEQQGRILALINPSLDTVDKYQVTQSMTAIGSGQIFGKGLFTNNTLSQLNFLPEPHTDFIFPVIVEALGFIGGAAIIMLYLMLILRSIRLSRKAKDKFGSYIIVGVCALLIAHVVENIGMTMGLMPVTGIPLPFVSYGGSFMWTSMIAFGLVLNVGMRRQVSIFRRPG